MDLEPAKRCRKCEQIKPFSEFYKNPEMTDGHLHTCKQCKSAATRKNRAENVEHYRAWDRERYKLPHRREAIAKHQKTEAWKATHKRSGKKYAEKFPNRVKAHYALNDAVKAGRIVPQPCLICGDKAEAHHPNYDAPLDVVWLCLHHHRQAHALVSNGRNSRGEANGTA